MRAYLAIKFYADGRNRPLIEAITAAFALCQIETFCVFRDLEDWGAKSFSAEELMQQSFDAIRSSDFVVIELSEKGVGLGIEAGYAAALRIPIVTIAKSGSDISTTLRGISDHVILYDRPEQLVQSIGKLELI